MNHLLTILFLELLLLMSSLACQSVAQLSGNQPLSAQSRDMPKLHFPEPWYEAAERPLLFMEQIEVRKRPNSSDDEFLFAALPHGDRDYAHEWQLGIPKPQYSQNSFAVNFTPTPRARVATEQEWESASRIVSKPRYVFSKGNYDDASEIEYRGRKYQKVGKYWGTGWLSPSGKWLATFSYSGVKTPPDIFFGGNTVAIGDMFWQIYDTVTGEKVFEWQATNVKSPASLNGPVVWLEERYFLFPVDEHAQTFNVVSLPEFVPEENPVTIQLPSRRDSNGARVPAPVNHPAWAPLVALTKEQAAELRAPQPPELVEVRSPRQSSSREFLLAIREVTENREEHKPARGFEPGMNYNYRLFSTYYYAISVDDPAQTRFASKEEWENSTSLRSVGQHVSLDTMTDTAVGKRRQFRPFPKTGEMGGSALTVTSDWIAIFSYTPAAGSSKSGKMFVDIFETRQGNKLSTTELPYTGSPVPLFDGALALEGHYLLLPLNPSLESFALWKLP